MWLSPGTDTIKESFCFNLHGASARPNSGRINWTFPCSFLLGSFPWKEQPTPSSCLWFSFLDSNYKRPIPCQHHLILTDACGCSVPPWGWEGRSLSRWPSVRLPTLTNPPSLETHHSFKREWPVCSSLSYGWPVVLGSLFCDCEMCVIYFSCQVSSKPLVCSHYLVTFGVFSSLAKG